MNIFEAFLVLLLGPNEIIGAGYRWKRKVFLMAIIGTISMPMFLVKSAAPYQGALPPQARIISVVGTFSFEEKYSGARKIAVANFMATDDRIFPLMDDAAMDSVRNAGRENQTQKYRMEGFFLLNGGGYFWPLSVRSSSASAYTHFRAPSWSLGEGVYFQ